MKVRNPQEPEKVKAGIKKNTRKWCRGKEGVEHDYWFEEVNGSRFRKGWCQVYWTCRNCGRRQHYIGAFVHGKQAGFHFKNREEKVEQYMEWKRNADKTDAEGSN